jgi:hypothetical protein
MGYFYFILAFSVYRYSRTGVGWYLMDSKIDELGRSFYLCLNRGLRMMDRMKLYSIHFTQAV